VGRSDGSGSVSRITLPNTQPEACIPSTTLTLRAANARSMPGGGSGVSRELRLSAAVAAGRRLDEVMYVPFGRWVSPTAFRQSVLGFRQFPAPAFRNVSVA